MQHYNWHPIGSRLPKNMRDIEAVIITIILARMTPSALKNREKII